MEIEKARTLEVSDSSDEAKDLADFSLDFVKKRSSIVIMILSALCIVLAVGLAAALTTAKHNESLIKDSRSTSLSSMTEDTMKKNAVSSAAVLLEMSLKTDSGKTVDERVQDLDGYSESEKTDLIDTDKVDQLIRFDSKLSKATVYQILIKLSDTVDSDKDGKIESSGSQSLSGVVVDPDTGIAYVPMTVFADDAPPYTMEMIYLDGKWQLQPYLLVREVALTALLKE